MSVLVTNKHRLTPRQYAQRQDRFKFHRVIKILRELELKENSLTQLLLEDDIAEKKQEGEEVKIPELPLL